MTENSKPILPSEIYNWTYGHECTICFGEITNRAVLDKCCHGFCYMCIIRWFREHNTCPFCKAVTRKLYYKIKSRTDYMVSNVRVPVANLLGQFPAFPRNNNNNNNNNGNNDPDDDEPHGHSIIERVINYFPAVGNIIRGFLPHFSRVSLASMNIFARFNNRAPLQPIANQSEAQVEVQPGHQSPPSSPRPSQSQSSSQPSQSQSSPQFQQSSSQPSWQRRHSAQSSHLRQSRPSQQTTPDVSFRQPSLQQQPQQYHYHVEQTSSMRMHVFIPVSQEQTESSREQQIPMAREATQSPSREQQMPPVQGRTQSASREQQGRTQSASREQQIPSSSVREITRSSSGERDRIQFRNQTQIPSRQQPQTSQMNISPINFNERFGILYEPGPSSITRQIEQIVSDMVELHEHELGHDVLPNLNEAGPGPGVGSSSTERTEHNMEHGVNTNHRVVIPQSDESRPGPSTGRVQDDDDDEEEEEEENTNGRRRKRKRPFDGNQQSKMLRSSSEPESRNPPGGDNVTN